MRGFRTLAWLFLAATPSLADEAFGRLFHTPEERRRLDEEIRRDDPGWQTLNGEIRRGRQPVAQWLDGRWSATPAPAGQVGDRRTRDGLRQAPLLAPGSLTIHRAGSSR